MTFEIQLVRPRKTIKWSTPSNQEGYSSETTTPGLNDGEKIPTRTETPKKLIKFITCNLYHVISILRVVFNTQR